MTVSTTETQKMPVEDAKGLSQFLVSLYFMSQEAHQMGLKTVANVFKDAINEIEQWLKSEESGRLVDEVVGSDLFQAMQFIGECALLPKNDLQKVLEALNDYDEIRRKAC